MIDLTKLTQADIDRFWTKVEVAGHDECWAWLGTGRPRGYGRFWFQGHTVAAHRVMYFIHRGFIPEGEEIDHTCRTVDCVNPRHLESVPAEVNRQRRIEHYKGESA